MDKLREEVARAIWRSYWGNEKPPTGSDELETMWFDMADAAILAVLNGIRDIGPLAVDQEFQSYALVKWHETVDALKAQVVNQTNNPVA